MEVSRETSVIIVTHNHSRYIVNCLKTVISNMPLEIIIVDNNSSDDTLSLIKKEFSQVEIIDLNENRENGEFEGNLLRDKKFSLGYRDSKNDPYGTLDDRFHHPKASHDKTEPRIRLIKLLENRGYSAGNNLGIKYAKGKYIVVLNPDTLVEEHWLEELVKPLERGEKVITTPKILLYDGSAINTCGNINHFTGLTFTRGLNEDPARYNILEEVSGFSGCCFAIKKSDFEEIGGFDESFFLYNEDSELSWRAHLKGFRIFYVPRSIVRHDYKLVVSPEKIYYLERNRYVILRKYFSLKDFLMLSPSLLMAELLTFGYAIRSGWKGIKSKTKGLEEGITAVIIRENGNRSQLIQSLCSTIPLDQLTFGESDRKIKLLINRIFNWNYKVAT